MAGNVSTIDGLGFEEANQASSTALISGTNVYAAGSLVGANLEVTDMATFVDMSATTIDADTVSGTAIRTTNVSVVGSVTDTDGRYRSSLLGSSTVKVYGGFIQAGSFDTSAGSIGFISFGTPYTSATSYYVNATATGSIAGYEESYVSGARNVSGVGFVGAAALRYDWIAVGI